MKKQSHRVTIDGIKVYCSYDKIEKLENLTPNPKNPNKHPDKQIELLADIIMANGWRDRIVVSNLSGMIVKGHGRYQAAIRAGLSKAPVEYQNYLVPEDEIKDLIADNKIAEFSFIDNDEALDLIQSLENFDLDLSTDLSNFGFRNEEIENLFPKQMSKKKTLSDLETITEEYQILIYCDDENQQIELLNRFEKEMIKCRALIS